MANKAVNKLKDHKIHLVLPDLDPPKHFKLITYSNAAHVNLPSGVS